MLEIKLKNPMKRLEQFDSVSSSIGTFIFQRQLHAFPLKQLSYPWITIYCIPITDFWRLFNHSTDAQGEQQPR
jgi:hypothetical protein